MILLSDEEDSFLATRLAEELGLSEGEWRELEYDLKEFLTGFSANHKENGKRGKK